MTPGLVPAQGDRHTEVSSSLEKPWLHSGGSPVPSPTVPGASRGAEESRHCGDALKGGEDKGEDLKNAAGRAK